MQATLNGPEKDAIAVDNMSNSYGKRSVPKGISFQVGDGEPCVLMGSNGSSKTNPYSVVASVRAWGRSSLPARKYCTAVVPSCIFPIDEIWQKVGFESAGI